MIYPINNQHIPQTKRKEINEKILYVIGSNSKQIPKEAIFNCYTGIGGLHELNFSDYESFHDYTEAKKEIEMGQFFTPHSLCHSVIEVIHPEIHEKIIDMCCGSGNFFNYLPDLKNVHGIDIDTNAIKVAKYLYPEANIKELDIRQYEPTEKFDIVIGNPPFNLKFRYDGKDVFSQFYYCLKAADILNPAGLLVLITPMSFLNDEFWNKTQVNNMNKRFSFIGQSELPTNAFKAVGVNNFATKILVFQRLSEHIESNKYESDTFYSIDALKIRVSNLREQKKAIRLKLVQEVIQNAESNDFEYRVKKYLYEIRIHKVLKPDLEKALNYIEQFRTQEPPKTNDADAWKEWNKTKITENKVLAYLKRIIKKQNPKKDQYCRLIKTKNSIKSFHDYPINDLIANDYDLKTLFSFNIKDVGENTWTIDKYKKAIIKYKDENKKSQRGFIKLINRKKKEYTLQSAIYSSMEHIPELDNYISNLTFKNPKNQDCHFTNLQQHDMGLIFQKRYALLNWQQGSGKTAVAYHYGKYHIDAGRVKNVFVLAPALATNITWKPFLERNGQKFVQFTELKDLNNITDGDFVLIPNSLIGKYKKHLQRFIKMKSQKVCLIFDESDEITNPLAARTRATLDIFRRVRYKMLATGTTTRNNIGELYSQFELLYNNSVNMLNNCDWIYHENKEREIEKSANDDYGYPFPARGGHTAFKYCFCPGKATVFGIEKHNQDIFNSEELTNLIDKTIITRKFKEFAGEKYTIKTHNILPSVDECEVYRQVIEEFHAISNLYFKSTGDSKKDAMLRLIRQINLLIKACSTPNYMPGYLSDNLPTKTSKIVNMISSMPDEKVAIGCTTIEALQMYVDVLSDRFFGRQIFVIDGSVAFKKREKIIKDFEASFNGILICTQQSLKSSVNIPTCNQVIMEALQWNIPKMEQFYFRFIRLDSNDHTTVHFINYVGTIEQNVMALVLTKERINEFIKSGEVKDQSEIFEEFDISENMLQSILSQSVDDEGRRHISWGKQNITIN